MLLVCSALCLEQLVYWPTVVTNHQIQNTKHIKYVRYRRFAYSINLKSA